MYDNITCFDKIKIELNMLHKKSKTTSIYDGLFMPCLFGRATKEKACTYAQNSVPNQ